MSAGIGLFLAFIGYQASEGIGVVTADGATLVNLGEPLPFPSCKIPYMRLQRHGAKDAHAKDLPCLVPDFTLREAVRRCGYYCKRISIQQGVGNDAVMFYMQAAAMWMTGSTHTTLLTPLLSAPLRSLEAHCPICLLLALSMSASTTRCTQVHSLPFPFCS